MPRREDKWKRKTLQRLQDTAVIEDARAACQSLADNILQAVQSRQPLHPFSSPNRSVITNDEDPRDSVSEENSSIFRALHRGSQRGARESADDAMSWTGLSTALSMIEESSTTSSTNTTVSKNQKKDRKQIPPPFRNKRYVRKRDASHDVWMCGVCGKVYASQEAASKHERAHILQVVQRLLPTTITNNSSSTFAAFQNSIYQSANMYNYFQGQDPTVSTWLAQDDNTHTPSTRFVLDNTQPALNSPRRLQDHEIDQLLGGGEPMDTVMEDDGILLPHGVRENAVHADQALVDVTLQAIRFTPWLSEQERNAEQELYFLANDEMYYEMLARRRQERQSKPGSRYRSDKKNLVGKVQNKFVDAYQIMKASKGQSSGLKDQYALNTQDKTARSNMIDHKSTTLYVNVMVKNSIQVVRHELERLARERWKQIDQLENATRFERFRVVAHANFVKLAGLALQSDFTPRRIAVQLSNDLYRLLTPRLKRRGVTIETEIEYRVGPYFVIATNITQIDWGKLIKATNKDFLTRRAGWAAKKKSDEEEGQPDNASKLAAIKSYLASIYGLTMFDVLAQVLAWMYYVHWTIYFPICWLAWQTSYLGNAIRQFIISSVTDEIFNYIEEKGMEMEIEIRNASTQTAFMLAALREIRADGLELKKKQKESESEEKSKLLGPLLGPAIKADILPVSKPDGFVIPENLEYVGLDVDLPIGFRRLRWGLLASDSKFVVDAIYRQEARYENITWGAWDKFQEHIGQPKLPDNINPSDFEGAQKQACYLMPKSAFVKANMCYETMKIEVYNDYCFCFKKQAKNPDAPFGSTFIAWTQFVVINNGDGTCKLTCSVEPEFPNGPPLVRKQITSGMRAGVGELFVLIGETISKYADEYP